MDSGQNQKEGNYKKHNRGNRGQKRGRGGYRGSNQNYMYKMNSGGGYPYYQNQYFSPYFQQQILYRTEMYIVSRYKHLIDINNVNASFYEKVDNNSKFFVIKSFSEEDVHKSIKYGVWSSSKNGNLTLTNAFQITKEKNGNVYLFFSCNGSGRYVGVARMKTPCDENKIFEYWTQDGKWPGLFDVEWLFIKDVPFKEFKDIIITMKDGEVKPISNARDTQEIPFKEAKIMLEKISKYQNKNTILEHFEFYDMRQENYEKNIAAKKNYESKNNQQNNNTNEIKKEDEK